ncbi:MAG: methylenetetrahydrofolate reductase C-terminal domain-containing protein, partial [Desulfobulbaceae bacterium]|nr:methylenetetrahydrofolate reductase C-terminal domain-containing protein [Desulfobulbaceae bacterium]
MIVAEPKELAEVLEMVAPYDEILVVGCNTCMADCSAGGQKEVERLAKDLVAEREDLIVEKTTIPRQCSIKFIERLQDKVRGFKAVLSMGCGNGVQMLARQFPDIHVLPALNTRFIGAKDENGVWNETCMACGNCILWRTGGICPVTRCAKGLLN